MAYKAARAVALSSARQSALRICAAPVLRAASIKRSNCVFPSARFFMRKRPNRSEIVEVYIDESSQTGHQYLVLGGVGIEATDIDKLDDLIRRARLPELPAGEAKWTKVSKSKLPAYKRIVDIVFGKGDLVHFHSLVVNTHHLDNKRFNDGNREVGFNKEIYQLAMKFGKLYPGKLFHVYPDRRKTNQEPNELRLILNRGCAKGGDKRDWPFRRCQFRDSDKTPALQLVDILTGAIAFDLNGHAKAANASPAKRELSEYILGCASIRSAHAGTARTGRFTIWHRQLVRASRSPRP
jgi:Protein of unknown function (DUF3800)